MFVFRIRYTVDNEVTDDTAKIMVNGVSHNGPVIFKGGHNRQFENINYTGPGHRYEDFEEYDADERSPVIVASGDIV